MSDPPRNIGEALSRFHQVLASRGLPGKRRPYLVMWVKRFDALRVSVLNGLSVRAGKRRSQRS